MNTSMEVDNVSPAADITRPSENMDTPMDIENVSPAASSSGPSSNSFVKTMVSKKRYYKKKNKYCNICCEYFCTVAARDKHVKNYHDSATPNVHISKSFKKGSSEQKQLHDAFVEFERSLPANLEVKIEFRCKLCACVPPVGVDAERQRTGREQQNDDRPTSSSTSSSTVLQEHVNRRSRVYRSTSGNQPSHEFKCNFKGCRFVGQDLADLSGHARVHYRTDTVRRPLYKTNPIMCDHFQCTFTTRDTAVLTAHVRDNHGTHRPDDRTEPENTPDDITADRTRGTTETETNAQQIEHENVSEDNTASEIDLFSYGCPRCEIATDHIDEHAEHENTHDGITADRTRGTIETETNAQQIEHENVSEDDTASEIVVFSYGWLGYDCVNGEIDEHAEHENTHDGITADRTRGTTETETNAQQIEHENVSEGDTAMEIVVFSYGWPGYDCVNGEIDEHAEHENTHDGITADRTRGTTETETNAQQIEHENVSEGNTESVFVDELLFIPGVSDEVLRHDQSYVKIEEKVDVKIEEKVDVKIEEKVNIKKEMDIKTEEGNNPEPEVEVEIKVKNEPHIKIEKEDIDQSND